MIVFETAPGTATTGTKFPNFKAREPAPTRSRQGKALRGEEENLVRERNPRREKSLTFNLSSKSKFSPASNRFVHHQVNNVGQTLSRDIDQFIRSNPLSEGFPPAPAVSSTSPPEVRRKPKLVQEEGGVRGVRSARGSPLFIHSFAHAAFDCGRPALWGWMDARQRWRTYTQSARARRCKKKGVGKSRTPCSWLQKDSMVRSRHCYGLSVSENANAGTST